MCVCLVATVVLRDDEGQYREAVKGVKRSKGGPFDNPQAKERCLCLITSPRLFSGAVDDAA